MIDPRLIHRLRTLADNSRQVYGLHAMDCVAAFEEAANAIIMLKFALADSIRSPMGVVPDSADGLVTQDELDAAEQRRRPETSRPAEVSRKFRP